MILDALLALVILALVYFAGFILFVPSLGSMRLSPGKALRWIASQWRRSLSKWKKPQQVQHQPRRHHPEL